MNSTSDRRAFTARDFVSFHRNALLATHSTKHPGYPFGSIVPYDVDDRGRPVIYISRISQHFANLSDDPKACLLVSERFQVDDPQNGGRISLLAHFASVPVDEQDEVSGSYRHRFPDSSAFDLAHDFVFFRGEPAHIRWIAGIGSMGWMDGEAYMKGESDPIVRDALPAVQHMNEDHQDALFDFVHAFGSKEAKGLLESGVPEMIFLRSSGFNIRVRTASAMETVSVPFQKPLEDPGEIRPAMIALLQIARGEASP